MKEWSVKGFHPVRLILRERPGQVSKVVLKDGGRSGRIKDIIELAERYDIPIEFKKGADEPYMAYIKGFNYTRFDRLLDSGIKRLLLLDRIQDAGNLGAIARNAAAFGVDAIVIPKHRSAKVTSTVIKRSAGLVFVIPFSIVTNLARTIDILKERGFYIVCGVATGGNPLNKVSSLPEKIALVLGNEKDGIRKGILKRADLKITIPMKLEDTSINVSSASAILIWSLFG